MEIACPFCRSKQEKSIKNWEYNNIDVNRFHCECGKYFNFYKSSKSSWTTIPKTKK